MPELWWFVAFATMEQFRMRFENSEHFVTDRNEKFGGLSVYLCHKFEPFFEKNMTVTVAFQKFFIIIIHNGRWTKSEFIIYTHSL